MKAAQGRVLMLVENAFPNDPRVKNECDVLTEAGYQVTVVALAKKCQTRSETVDGVQVYRVPRLELFRKLPTEHPTLGERLLLRIQSTLGSIVDYVHCPAD